MPSGQGMHLYFDPDGNSSSTLPSSPPSQQPSQQAPAPAFSQQITPPVDPDIALLGTLVPPPVLSSLPSLLPPITQPSRTPRAPRPPREPRIDRIPRQPRQSRRPRSPRPPRIPRIPHNEPYSESAPAWLDEPYPRGIAPPPGIANPSSPWYTSCTLSGSDYGSNDDTDEYGRSLAYHQRQIEEVRRRRVGRLSAQLVERIVEEGLRLPGDDAAGRDWRRPRQWIGREDERRRQIERIAHLLCTRILREPEFLPLHLLDNNLPAPDPHQPIEQYPEAPPGNLNASPIPPTGADRPRQLSTPCPLPHDSSEQPAGVDNVPSHDQLTDDEERQTTNIRRHINSYSEFQSGFSWRTGEPEHPPPPPPNPAIDHTFRDLTLIPIPARPRSAAPSPDSEIAGPAHAVGQTSRPRENSEALEILREEDAGS